METWKQVHNVIINSEDDDNGVPNFNLISDPSVPGAPEDNTADNGEYNVNSEDNVNVITGIPTLIRVPNVPRVNTGILRIHGSLEETYLIF